MKRDTFEKLLPYYAMIYTQLWVNRRCRRACQAGRQKLYEHYYRDSWERLHKDYDPPPPVATIHIVPVPIEGIDAEDNLIVGGEKIPFAGHRMTNTTYKSKPPEKPNENVDPS